MKVLVYRNLTNKSLSIMALEGPRKGLVIARPSRAWLSGCSFVVRQGGRRKVLETRRKNVHAFVRGTLCRPFVPRGRRVTYNPYKHETFVRASDESPISAADRVYVAASGRMMALGGS